MVNRADVKRLHDLYCKPKPQCIFQLVDSQTELLDDTEREREEKQSQDLYVYLII